MPNRASFIQHSNKEEEEKKPNKKNQNKTVNFWKKISNKCTCQSTNKQKEKKKNISKIATK